MKLQTKAFTLVELIVVITILAVLSTIGFVSYSGYLSGVRDTNRISQLKSISEGLKLYSTNHSLPSPESDGATSDSIIDVIANNELIAYQGYVGKNVLETITYSTEGVDPKDKQYFSYYLTKDKKYYQLMALLEDEDNAKTSSLLNRTNAIDYSTRYPTVFGDKLGILTDENNTPIQDVAEIQAAGEIDLGGTNSGTVYSAHINDGRTYTFSGRVLNHKLYTISKPGKYGPPKDCPDGFIASWGDSTFDQVGFCVAEYEMTYAEEDSPINPNSSQSADLSYWNTYSYDDDKNYSLDFSDTGYGKKIVSRAGDYPIAELTQLQAIEACQSLGSGYHLIMNKEWMSIARQAELQKENWSTGIIGEGFIYNGVSGNVLRGCDKYGGNSESRDYGTKTGPGNNDCNEKRNLTLFNYQEIWDMAGNVHEWVNGGDTLDGTNYEVNGEACNTLNTWFDWVGSTPGTDVCDYINGYTKETHGPLLDLTYDNGAGILKAFSGSKVFMRGFAADADDATSIYSLHLVEDYQSSWSTIGFRCAYLK